MQPDTDNLMPKGGQFFASTDPEVQKEAETEKAKVYNAQPLIEEIVSRFDERIAFYNSVDSIPVELHENPEQFMHAVAAAKATKDYLTSERNYLESLLDEYTR